MYVKSKLWCINIISKKMLLTRLQHGLKPSKEERIQTQSLALSKPEGKYVWTPFQFEPSPTHTNKSRYIVNLKLFSPRRRHQSGGGRSGTSTAVPNQVRVFFPFLSLNFCLKIFFRSDHLFLNESI